MKLEKMTLEGFRRYHEKTDVNLSGKLVAIVGSNEAGKTSLLKAIAAVSDAEPISVSDKTHLGANDIKITLSYFLDEADLAEAGLSDPSWLTVHKRQNGKRNYQVTPKPSRDFGKRIAAEKLSSKLLASAKTRSSIEKAYPTFGFDAFEKILATLSSRDVWSEEDIERVDEAIDQLKEIGQGSFPAYVQQLHELLQELQEFEKEHDPHQFAVNALHKRTPPILFFGADDRHIALPYSLSSFLEGSEAARPSKPLTQVIRLAKLDMEALAEADRDGNEAVKTGLLASANEELRRLSEGLWSQSDACLFLTVSNGSLDVLVEHKDGFEARDRYNNLRDRSDGYRQFVALQIFGFLQAKTGAVLLIDEIEHHLHYDAQADLIQLLQREPSIQKVVYTTHSAGALPEDLGVGVRLAQWVEGNKKYSTINNKFWARAEKEGFRPLLFGMGAATLAFFPTRKALIGEGVTEMLLLPRLFRDAVASSGLGFQIVHGLSNLSPKGLPMIDAEQASVAYIVDGDPGGSNIMKDLLAAGVPSNFIFNLKSSGAVTVEDLVDKGLWKEAVINLMRKYNPGLIETLKADSFPDRGRIAALPSLVSSRKVEIAYEILDLCMADPHRKVIANGRREKVARLADAIAEALKVKC